MVKNRKGIKHKIYFWLKIVFLTLLAVIQLFPLIWLLDFSLCKSNQLFGENILVWPNPPQWINYYQAIFESHFFTYFKNSIIINGLAVIFVVIFAIMAAFACTRMRWKLKPFVSMVFLLGLMIPTHATILPNYLVFSRLKITDTIFALLLPYVAFQFSMAFLLTSSYLESIPVSLEESALLDGCGIHRMLFQLILPLMKPSITTVAITTFLSNWNEFLSAMTYLKTDQWKTLPFLVLEFTGLYSSDYALQFAVMAMSALPALVVYIFMNKSIVKGIAVGAVKG